MAKEVDTDIKKKKAQFFYDRKIEVHITKLNNWFHNGFITEINDDFLIINDDKEGDMPIFYPEIFEIEKREVET